jgi:hypothetical protein
MKLRVKPAIPLAGQWHSISVMGKQREYGINGNDGKGFGSSSFFRLFRLFPFIPYSLFLLSRITHSMQQRYSGM